MHSPTCLRLAREEQVLFGPVGRLEKALTDADAAELAVCVGAYQVHRSLHSLHNALRSSLPSWLKKSAGLAAELELKS